MDLQRPRHPSVGNSDIFPQVLLDDFTEAAQNYRQALAIDPNNVEMRACLDGLLERVAKETPDTE